MGIFAIISFIVVITVVGCYAYYRSRKIDTHNTDGYFMGAVV
ncbi:Uncharacterised protein [Staphylococcus agnetis]|nr:Uncharacterised protein [Staphylococcus agnetis]